MEISTLSLEEARKARFEKNVFSIFEITTTPGMLERIEYLISPGDRLVDALCFAYTHTSENYTIPRWAAFYKGEILDLFLTDASSFKVQWKHACDPALANLKYTLGA